MVDEKVVELIKRDAGSEEGKLPFTPRAKAVLRSAGEEALQLGHNYIGTEHLLLGLFADEDSIAAKVLRDCGARQNIVRERTLELLADYGTD